MEEIKAYKPKCCSKAYITKRACVEHEKRCLWNPDNEACHTCGKREVVDGEEKRWYCPVRDRLIGIFEAGNEMLPVSHCEDWEPNQRCEDSFDGTYYWAIEGSPKYVWANYLI